MTACAAAGAIYSAGKNIHSFVGADLESTLEQTLCEPRRRPVPSMSSDGSRLVWPSGPARQDEELVCVGLGVGAGVADVSLRAWLVRVVAAHFLASSGWGAAIGAAAAAVSSPDLSLEEIAEGACWALCGTPLECVLCGGRGCDFCASARVDREARERTLALPPVAAVLEGVREARAAEGAKELFEKLSGSSLTGRLVGGAVFALGREMKPHARVEPLPAGWFQADVQTVPESTSIAVR